MFEPDTNERVNPDKLRTQWRLYNKVLQDLLMNKATGFINMSSLDILRCLIDPKKELYRYFACRYILKFFSSGIEDVLSILVRAAVAISMQQLTEDAHKYFLAFIHLGVITSYQEGADVL